MLMITMTLQQVIITTDNVDVGTVDNQENVEPDNRKDPARFVNLIFHVILMTLTIMTRMTDLELKRRNRRESNQIQKTQEGMVSMSSSIIISIVISTSIKTSFNIS